MKRNIKKIIKLSSALLICIMLMLGISFSASAEESTATQVIATEGGGVLQDGRENIFENTYKLLEANADKIFSALAFMHGIHRFSDTYGKGKYEHIRRD